MKRKSTFEYVVKHTQTGLYLCPLLTTLRRFRWYRGLDSAGRYRTVEGAEANVAEALDVLHADKRTRRLFASTKVKLVRVRVLHMLSVEEC